MNAGKNQRALLIEIMVAVLFFALCATILLQTFMAARENSRQAGLRSEAMAQLQALSEQLYAAEDAEAFLTDAGFRVEEGAWTKDAAGYQLRALPETEDAEAGSIRRVTLEAISQGETLAQLPNVRYLPGEANP